MYYKVVLQAKQGGIADGLTYESSASLRIGDLVTVPLRGKRATAIVVEEVKQPEYSTKHIELVTCEQLLQPEHVRLALRVAKYYFAPLRSAIGLFLPGTSWRQYCPDAYYCLNANFSGKLTISGKKVQSALEQEKILSQSELEAAARVTKATITKYVKEGLLTLAASPAKSAKQHRFALPALNNIQTKVTNAIEPSKPNYLFGVTGSGKTEVYCNQIKQTLEQGKVALVLLPEIFVTEHSKERYYKYFPTAKIVTWHSKMTPKERLQTWKQIQSGNVDIIIGSRSALFTPWQNLGCIIVDEEHEWTYKQETQPRYHARTAALEVQKQTGATIIMGSATPSLEAWHAMQTAQWNRLDLPERYNNQPMPDVQVVDLAQSYSSTAYPFSDDLVQEITATLERNEKVVLFLNKRGVASCVLCTKCKRRLMSASTQLPLSVHRNHVGEEVLYDQFTQSHFPIPANCPHCNHAELLTVGIGTQGIEELCKHLFKNVPLWRIDGDTLSTGIKIQTVLDTISTSQKGIIIGTQSVVKGLDLPDVTLSAVLIADIGLSLPHFRASERVFQLLMQLTGRSGRHRPGKVLIQTFRPESDEITAVKEHNAELFYTKENALRKAHGYPPHTPLVKVVFRAHSAQTDAKSWSQKAQAYVNTHLHKCTVLCSPTYFSGGKIWQCLLIGPDALNIITAVPPEGYIDVDALETV